MVSAIKCAFVAPILLSTVLLLMSGKLVQSDKDIISKLNNAVPDEKVQGDIKYFMEHYPLPKDEATKKKIKQHLDELAREPEKQKARGAPAAIAALSVISTLAVGLYQSIGGIITGIAAAQKQSTFDYVERAKIALIEEALKQAKQQKWCETSGICECRDPGECKRPQCPPIPHGYNQCAHYAECHPACRLEVVKWEDLEAQYNKTTTATTSTTTTGKPNSSTKLPKVSRLTTKSSKSSTTSPQDGSTSTAAPSKANKSLRSGKYKGSATTAIPQLNPEGFLFQSLQTTRSPVDENELDFYTPPDDDQERQLTCCMDCMRKVNSNCSTKKSNSKNGQKIKKSNRNLVTKKDPQYRFTGLYQLSNTLNVTSMDQKSKDGLLNSLAYETDGKLDDPKLLEAINGILEYFGDKPLTESEQKKTKGNNRVITWDTLGSIETAGAAAIMHLSNAARKQREREACGCPGKHCVPNKLEMCEGFCPNRPGCAVSVCRCRLV